MLAAMLVGTMEVVAADPPQSQKQAASVQPSKCTDLSGQPIACPETADQTPKAGRDSSGDWSLEKSLPKNLVLDQKDLWTSPLRFRLHDLTWAVPFAGVTAGLFATDTDIEKHLPSNPNTIKRAQDFSKYGVAGFTGLVGGSYLWGRFTHNDHLRRTGLLSGEAAVGTLVSTLPIKFITGRDRPLEGDGTGKFWQGHLSFPSEHSAAAWSIASVFAHEYPSLPVQALAYSAATAMTASRVIGRKHWSSDAFVGSALGWYFGRQVYKRHEESELADAAYGTFRAAPDTERPRNTANMGSPYVPLDSWVYPAIDRLAALGYVRTAFMGLRPWTRTECARVIEDVGDLAVEQGSTDALALYAQLRSEFKPEIDSGSGVGEANAEVESLYSRVVGISGQPLRDGYHFGQTLTNDFGRPYSEGANTIAGVSVGTHAGPLAGYVRFEYQHTPSAPTLSLPVREAMANVDFHAGALASGVQPEVSRGRLLDAYFSLNVLGLQLSFGKQSLWWGPGSGGAMLFSANAEPILMLRADRVSPLRLPGPLKMLGPVRMQSFLGQLTGHRFVNTEDGLFSDVIGRPIKTQPFILGHKVSFKPTPNFEFGVSLTTLFGGPKFPFNAHRFFHTLVSTGNSFGPNDPGDRRTGFDFSYKIPKLRNWLVLYNDSFAEDELSPIGYPRRSAMNPGIYMPQIPGIRKLDFRAEGVYTDLPNLHVFPGYYYFNVRYLDGYTNAGQLIGSWVGRQGYGWQASSTYWFSAQNTIQAAYRDARVSRDFVLGGGSINDISIRTNWYARTNTTITALLQYERWSFPLLARNPNADITASIQIRFSPHWAIR